MIAGLVLTAFAHVLGGRLKGRIDERRSSIKRPNSTGSHFVIEACRLAGNTVTDRVKTMAGAQAKNG